MPEPTEGPWTAPPSGAYGQWPVLGPNFEAIAFATAQPGDRSKAAANARRMAAAADMEAVLERLVYHWNDLDIEARRELMTDARVAIAKAKGES